MPVTFEIENPEGVPEWEVLLSHLEADPSRSAYLTYPTHSVEDPRAFDIDEALTMLVQSIERPYCIQSAGAEGFIVARMTDLDFINNTNAAI